MLQPVSDMEQDEDEDETSTEERTRLEKAARQYKQDEKKRELFNKWLEATPQVIKGLSNLSPALGHVFKQEFWIEALRNGVEPKAMYQKLFLNVSTVFK